LDQRLTQGVRILARFLPWLACCLIALTLASTGSVPDCNGGDEAPADALRELIYAYPDSAALYAELAAIYFERGTVRGRLLARQNMEQALRLDPRNANYHMMLAEVYFEGTFWHYGVDELKLVLEIDGTNSDARCRLGEAYLEHGVEEWQLKWFDRAKQELCAVDSGQPAYAAAARHLAQCHFDLGKPDSAVTVLQRLPEDSRDADALLVMGMALCEQNKMKEASEAFFSALDAMDPETRNRYISLELVATRDELREISDAKPDEIEAVMLEQWKRRDPNPATRVNERLVEHFARVAFADIHFALPRLGRVGSETARGEVYIRYGRPLAWYYDPLGSGIFADETVLPRPALSGFDPGPRAGYDDGPDLNDPGRAYRSRPLKVSKSRWMWRYPGFSLNFEDTFLNGDYQFPFEQDWSAYVYAFLEKRIPEIYETHIKNRMRVVLDALNFIDRYGRPSVKIVYACDTRGVGYASLFEWPRGDFDVEIAVLDSSYMDVSRAEFSTSLRADSSVLFQTRYPLIGSYVVHIPEGKSVAAVSLESKATEAAGFAKRSIEVRDFGEGLEISDIELRFGEQGPPNPSHVYLRRGKAYVAFSIYNLVTDAHDTGRAEIAYEIRGQLGTRPAYRRFLDLLTGGHRADREGLASIWSKYDLRSQGSQRDEVIGIDLSPLSAGDYEIEIKVTDRWSREITVGRTVFTIASDIDS
jgi:GWxTD domain-containing protein